ncbi:putative late blight resistance protein homolog R1A-3 [Henckelia pumila]|uniref:putative late blight resistance protein homolog R1A-3 n=1 Tax=Henckelia pumila TaxID=405737 RepID=UPI003C6E96FE
MPVNQRITQLLGKKSQIDFETLRNQRSTMAAYASLLSLGHILDHILQHPPRQTAVLDKAQVDSLLEIIIFLQEFLEDFSLIRRDEIQGLEDKIARTANAAEDIIESRVVDQILGDAEAASERSSSTLFCQDLQNVIQEFDSMKKDAMKINETEGIKIIETAGSFIRGASDSKNTMVGFDKDLIQIVDTLTGDQSNLQILSIVGMGGIGKTTLAKNVFENPLIVQHFDRRAWVTVSQQFSVHELLLGLIKDVGVPAGENEREITRKNDGELGLCLHKSLSDRRYLIVMDDIWSIEVWDGIKRFLPNYSNGSRVLVTTRLSNVADSLCSCTPQELHFLDDDKSWTLFHDKVFGKESCPPELEEAGKTIVRNCKGLPLAIVAIGGLLAKSSRTLEYWEYVANDTSAALNMGGDGLCFEVLYLSYKHLPVHLKPCFLYMATFPEDSKIKISRLVKLWIAEGILKPIGSRSLEEIGEDNLKDLTDRNLIQVHDYGSRNKIKTCTIHDLLRDLCLKEAQKEKFLCVASVNSHPRSIDNKRRLVIHQQSPDEGEFHEQVFDAMNLLSCTRSLICQGFKCTEIKLPVCLRLLRVLSMLDVYSSVTETLQLVNLRYNYFESPTYKELLNILESLALLWNLQTVTIAGIVSFTESPINLPAEIWEMVQLRHLKMEEGDFYLPDPPSTNGENSRRDITVLKNLQTLYKIRNFRCTEEVVGRLPNLKKLGITYTQFPSGFGWDYYEVYNLAHLRNLESLFLDSAEENVLQHICFPHDSLKKLTLRKCGVSWEDLSVVGSLPHLEVLHLMDGAVIGSEWNPVEGEFLELKCLRMKLLDVEEWIAESSHFPCLEKLQLELLPFLEEIPYGIGEIQTLQSISLTYCSDSANSSAKKIQEEQQELGNYELQVHVREYSLGSLAMTVIDGVMEFGKTVWDSFRFW